MNWGGHKIKAFILSHTKEQTYDDTLKTCFCLHSAFYPITQVTPVLNKLITLEKSSYLLFKWSTIVAIIQPKNYFILVAGMNLREEENILLVLLIPIKF